MSVVDTGWPCLCLGERGTAGDKLSSTAYEERERMGGERTARRKS